MDYDYILNETTNSTEKVFEKSINTNVYDSVSFTVSMVSAMADILIIYSVARFKNMHNKRNILVANWATADLIFQLSNPTIYDVTMMDIIQESTVDIFCFLYRSEVVYISAAGIFVTILTLDFLYQNITLRNIKIILPIIWILIIGKYIVAILVCLALIVFHSHYYVAYVIFTILGLAFLTKAYIYFINFRKNKKISLKLRYILSTCFVLCWAPNGLINIPFINCNWLNTYGFLLAECLGASNPIFNVYLLMKYDRNFRSCFLHIFKCQPVLNTANAVSYKDDLTANKNNVVSDAIIDADDNV